MTGGMSVGTLLLPVAAGLFREAAARDYGDLVPDPEGILDLPPGFTYRVIQRREGSMTDGFLVPALPDGMACFLGADGNWVLMQNHEVPLFLAPLGPYGFGEAPAEAFDADGYGGVTRLVIDPVTLELLSNNLVLAGTSRNCAGGPSPWGWLSCEEAGDDSGHGYVFLCDVEAATVQMPRQILGYGRMNHEAVAVDPATHVAYLTEDRGNGCLYRFVPIDPCEPFVGRLQALRVVGEDNALTTQWRNGTIVSIDWVDIEDINPTDDTIRVEAQDKGAALFRRGEGIDYYDGQIWFTSTDGGPAGSGQIYRLTDGPEGGELELVTQSEDKAVLDFPDNIAIAPWGQLFLCEDGSSGNYLRVLTEAGEVRPFARNSLSNSEFAGVCFSPDGTVLFVNLQFDALTLAITGPFPKARAAPPVEPPECTPGAEDAGSSEDSGDSQDSSGGPAGTTGVDAASSVGSGESADDTPGSAATDGGEGNGCGCDSSGDGAGGVAATALAVVLAASARPSPGGSTPVSG